MYDPNADVFEKDIASPFFHEPEPIPEAEPGDEEQSDSQRIDFDKIMHENFQYENTMNHAHLKRFNRHTGELMFSRAAMRHMHQEKLRQ